MRYVLNFLGLAVAAAVLATVIAGCGAAPTAQHPAQTPTPTPSAAATPAPPPPPATPKAAAPKVILAPLSGSGQGATAPFSAPAHWILSYHYDCSAFGMAGNFAVTLEQGSMPVAVPVNEMGMSGTKTTDVYTSGSGLHLDINSECDWTVSAESAS